MGLVNQPVKVKLNRDGKPQAFWWRKRWLPVFKILDYWHDVGAWWEGEMEKIFFRLAGSHGEIYELFRQGDDWYLYKVYD